MHNKNTGSIRITIGNPVEGVNFYGREKEQKQLWQKTETSHLLMLAPRRIGKTSLLKRLRDTAHQQNAKVFYCSFADCKDETACIERLYKTLKLSVLKKQVNEFGNILKRLKKAGPTGVEIGETSPNDWHSEAAHFHAQLDTLQTNEKRIIICVDELPIFIVALLNEENGEEKTKNFLNWFRSIRQDYHHKIKWILAGSIGLDTITARHNMGDTINDLASFPLGEFDSPTSSSFYKKYLLVMIKLFHKK